MFVLYIISIILLYWAFLATRQVNQLKINKVKRQTKEMQSALNEFNGAVISAFLITILTIVLEVLL